MIKNIMKNSQLLLNNLMKFTEILKHTNSSVLLWKLGKSISPLTGTAGIPMVTTWLLPGKLTLLEPRLRITEKKVDVVMT